MRVVCFGDVSKEFCGGTHVSNTQDIGLFVIEYEESVAAGVRRIQARTSSGAYELIKYRENVLNRMKTTLSVSSINDAPNRLNALVNEKDSYKKLSDSLADKLAYANSQSLKNSFIDINNHKVLISYQKGSKRNDLMNLVDNLKQGLEDYVIILVGEENGGLPIVVSCSPKAIASGNRAGDIVRGVAQILGGSGGGRPEIASGAGKDSSKVNEAMESAKGLIK